MSWHHYDKDFILARIVKDENECWNWTGKPDSKGYGRVSYGSGENLAHRLSYKLFKGDFDKTLKICHTCDNGMCCNPEHLFVGTQAENMTDCINKGRFLARSIGNPSKLSQRTIERVLEALENGEKHEEIARRLLISSRSVRKIKKTNLEAKVAAVRRA